MTALFQDGDGPLRAGRPARPIRLVRATSPAARRLLSSSDGSANRPQVANNESHCALLATAAIDIRCRRAWRSGCRLFAAVRPGLAIGRHSTGRRQSAEISDSGRSIRQAEFSSSAARGFRAVMSPPAIACGTSRRNSLTRSSSNVRTSWSQIGFSGSASAQAAEGFEPQFDRPVAHRQQAVPLQERGQRLFDGVGLVQVGGHIDHKRRRWRKAVQREQFGSKCRARGKRGFSPRPGDSARVRKVGSLRSAVPSTKGPRSVADVRWPRRWPGSSRLPHRARNRRHPVLVEQDSADIVDDSLVVKHGMHRPWTKVRT